MRKIHFIFFFSIIGCLSAGAQINYDDYFTDQRMRVDLVFAGDHNTTEVFLEKVKAEPQWGGTRTHLADPLNLGDFQYRITDAASGKLIFSRGMSTLWEEWQTTAEAQSVKKYLTESLVFPFPKNKVLFELHRRNDDNIFEKCFEMDIDPADPYIERNLKFHFVTGKMLDNGDPAKCVDLVFVAEGYTKEEIDSFYRDVKWLSESLLSMEPYSEYRDKFNVWTVASVSADSGTDFPGEGIWKNTIMNSNFYTFGIDRYLTTYDYRTVCDVAAPVPYDQIIVLINIDRYGGGGMYNNYCGGSNGGHAPEEVLIHEFGHGFAGLGDEYYTSEVAYNEYFKLSVEPWEPNLTTLVNFESKWKDMLDPGTPVPTPVEEKYMNKTGVFEGGGYVSKGVYRPAYDCRMKSNVAEGFCAACRRAITRTILYYTE
jgi:hypothetical protein